MKEGREEEREGGSKEETGKECKANTNQIELECQSVFLSPLPYVQHTTVTVVLTPRPP